MPQPKVDLRIQRTRKFIMDAFMTLSERKDFKDITVKDIATGAMINRATFYYHFEDIYDLLEKMLSEVLLVNLDYINYEGEALDEDTLIRIFTAITDFQQSLANRCHRGYEETIARIIREQLEVIFFKMLAKQNGASDEAGLKLTAVMLSWSMYGASAEWRRSGRDMSPETYIKSSLPYLMHGLDFKSNSGASRP
ncbi:TetR/AcrR family transcriptional regulator [Salinicoccus siamensis]|uniref:TetR/AcrR family transcriptional regulator n=1 Tax=Salinicoccus siamensis TaxID=381830 RepID=A0ABV5Z4D3_9STAP